MKCFNLNNFGEALKNFIPKNIPNAKQLKSKYKVETSFGVNYEIICTYGQIKSKILSIITKDILNKIYSFRLDEKTNTILFSDIINQIVIKIEREYAEPKDVLTNRGGKKSVLNKIKKIDKILKTILETNCKEKIDLIKRKKILIDKKRDFKCENDYKNLIENINKNKRNLKGN